VATPGVSVISPTNTVVLNVVLTNNGTVDEPHASVTFTLARLPTGTTTTARRIVSVRAARSVGLAPVAFAVKPGNSYQLTVAIAAPAGQVVAAGTTFVEGLQISPST
jgi:hypothetical protein